MQGRNFLYIALIGFGLYVLLKTNPKTIHKEDDLALEAKSQISASETNASNFEIDILVVDSDDHRTEENNTKPQLVTNRKPASASSVVQAQAQLENSSKKRAYVEIFSGLDTRPWLYKFKPGDMDRHLGVICNKCGKDHAADLFVRLIDLQNGEKLSFEENNSTAFIVNALHERATSIVFMKGEVPRASDATTSLIDTPTCKFNLSTEDLPKYQVSVKSFTVGKVEPVKISSRVSGVRIYRKDYGQKPKIYRGLESIECFVTSAKDNDDKFQMLNMRHLAATLGTNVLWDRPRSKSH